MLPLQPRAGRGLRGGSVLTDAQGNATLTVFVGQDTMVSAAPPVGSDLAGSGSRTVTLTPSSNLSFALTSTVALSGVIRATPASGFTVTVLLTLVAAVIPLAYIKRRGWLR